MKAADPSQIVTLSPIKLLRLNYCESIYSSDAVVLPIFDKKLKFYGVMLLQERFVELCDAQRNKLFAELKQISTRVNILFCQQANGAQQSSVARDTSLRIIIISRSQKQDLWFFTIMKIKTIFRILQFFSSYPFSFLFHVFHF